MNLEMAGELFAYNTWANRKMLKAASRLDSQQFTRELGGSYPSVQSTATGRAGGLMKAPRGGLQVQERGFSPGQTHERGYRPSFGNEGA